MEGPPIVRGRRPVVHARWIVTALRGARSSRPTGIVVTAALVMASVVAVAPRAAEASGGRRGEVFNPNPQPSGAPRVNVPGGFQDSIAWSGFTLPAALVFAANGRVYVGEKSGIVKTFDNLND